MKMMAMCLCLILMGTLFYCDQAMASPWIGARAWGLYDLKTGQFLDGKNNTQPMHPASTTKIMTALLALEYLDLDEIARVSEKADRTPSTTIGVRAGQEMRVRDVIVAALLTSGNDATVILAERVAGSEALFCHLMNKKAFILGATETVFKNSNGLTASGHLSSCRDLFLISREALRNEFFANTVALASAKIDHPSYPDGKVIRNTNRMLTTYPGTKGIKTGTTNAAGKCLVCLATRGERQLISVVLKSGDRYHDSTAILDRGFNTLNQTTVVQGNQLFKRVRVAGGDWSEVALYPERDVRLWLSEDGLNNVEKRVCLEYNPPAPIKKGDRIGSLEVYYKGELADIVGLTAKTTINRRPQGLWRLFKRPPVTLEGEEAVSFLTKPSPRYKVILNRASTTPG